jgi:hypothetical protein
MRQRGAVNLRNSRKATPDKALLDAVSRGAAKLLPYDDFSAQKPQLLRVDKSARSSASSCHRVFWLPLKEYLELAMLTRQ